MGQLGLGFRGRWAFNLKPSQKTNICSSIGASARSASKSVPHYGVSGELNKGVGVGKVSEWVNEWMTYLLTWEVAAALVVVAN